MDARVSISSVVKVSFSAYIAVSFIRKYMNFESWKRKWQSLSGQDKNKALGLLFIFAVALIWVLASFIVQEIEGEGLNPFVLTYIANSLFIVLLPINYVTTKLQRKRDR